MDKDALFQTLGYNPHAKQQLFHNSHARFRVVVAGRRSGKSLMTARECAPKLFQPNTRGWIVGPTYSLGEKEFRVLWDDLIIGQGLGKHKKVLKGYSTKQGNMYIELPWRSRVDVLSSDHPESLVGEGLDWVVMSEAAKHGPDIWERYLRPTLSDKKGFAIFSTTPEGQNWLYKLWQLGQDHNYPAWKSWQYPSWENTAVFPGGRQDPEILAVEKTTAKEWFDQEYGAEFTAFVGRIFDNWSESTHVRDVPFVPAWPSYIAFDWGFTRPMAAIEFQVSPRDTIHIWREYYEIGLTLEQHINKMRTRPNPEGYHLDLGFGDPADPAAVQYMGMHFVNTMADPESKKSWRQGVDLIDQFMQDVETGEVLDEYGTPKMEPRFFVDHSCKQLIHEINNYRAKPPPRTMYPADPLDAPIKKDDHGIDAIRYALVHLFELGAQHHLEEVAAYNPTIMNANSTRLYPEPDASQTVSPNDAGMRALRELTEVSYAGDETVFNFGSKEPIF